jgi:hypothetical protein
MAISFPEFRQFCQGKVGSIYIARNGSVTVVITEGKTYLYSNYGGDGVIENPAPEYWVNSIDRSGEYSDYWLLGMIPAADMPYKAYQPYHAGVQTTHGFRREA